MDDDAHPGDDDDVFKSPASRRRHHASDGSPLKSALRSGGPGFHADDEDDGAFGKCLSCYYINLVHVHAL